MARIYLVTGLFLLAHNILFSQSLEGVVIDADDEKPLTGANLYVKSDWRKGTSTDKEGTFSLNGIQQGDTLVISFIGYKEQFHVVTVIKPLVIALVPNTFNMNTVVVAAEKPVAEEFTYKKLSRLEIYLNPSAKADPLLAVNSMPAATTLDESANISFRGSSPAETGIFFNNVPIYDAVRFSQLNGIGTFSIFNTALVSEILVFPGNPPLEYGNTTSGLIAMQTTEELPESRTNTATISLASYGLFTQRPAGKKSAVTLFSNFQPSSVLKAMNNEALEDIQRFQLLDLGINYLSHLNDHTVLKLFNYSMTEGFDFRYQAPTFNGTFQQRKRRNFTVSNLRRQKNRSEWSFNSNLSFSQANFGVADMDIHINNFDAFLSANYHYKHPDFNVKTGVTIDYRQQKFDGTFYRYDFAQGFGFPVSNEQSTVQLNRPEVYVYTKYFLNEKTVIGGGLRKNLPTDLQDHYLSLQLNTNTAITKHAQLVLAWGRYHQYNLPQNDQETPFLIASDQVSADLQWKKDDKTVSGAIYGKRTIQTGQTTRLMGVEVFFEGSLFPGLKGQLSYALVNGNTMNETGEKYDARYDLDYFVRGNIQYNFAPGWTASANFTFRDGRHYQPLTGTVFNERLGVFEPEFSPLSQQERMGEYSIVDTSISRLLALKEKLSIILFGSISNIFDTKNIRSFTYNFDYSDRISQYFSRRTLYVGAVINF